MLDAGCGLDAPFARKFSREAVVLCEELPKDLPVVRGDLSRLPFSRGAFSMVCSRSVFEHLTEPDAVMDEIHRALKPGGFCVILTPNRWDYSSVVARLTPQGFHEWFVNRTYGANTHDTFPTRYRANTPAYFRSLAQRQRRWKIRKLTGLRHYPANLIFSRTLFRVGVVYDWLIARLGWSAFSRACWWSLRRYDGGAREGTRVQIDNRRSCETTRDQPKLRPQRVSACCAALTTLVLVLPALLVGQEQKPKPQTCGDDWCNTFPVAGVRLLPPFGSSAWNKLVYVPDDGRFYIYTSDGIVTFSNSWWSYAVLGHTPTTNPWVEESTSGTVQTTVTDNSKGFLKSPTTPTDSTITVGRGEGRTFHPDPKRGGTLIIDDEEVSYAGINLSNDTFVNVVRGVRGTTAASHSAGTMVNAGAPVPQSRLQNGLVPVNDHVPDRHPFLTSAYDSRRHQLFQAGGIIEGNKKTDTWYFCFIANEFCSAGDVRVWKRLLTPTAVPARADSAMDYDSEDDVMILYGGQSVGNPTADTWLLCFSADPQGSGKSVGCPKGRPYPDWVRLDSTNGSPGPRLAHSLVYDPKDHLVVLFGGMNGTATDPSETWIYIPATRTWTNAKPAGQNPASFRRPAMTYDSRRNRVVLYEGPPEKIEGFAGGLYLYDAGKNKWELSPVQGGPIPTSPGPEHAHGRLSLAYDAKTDTFVATEVGPGYALQTWELKGAALDRANPSRLSP